MDTTSVDDLQLRYAEPFRAFLQRRGRRYGKKILYGRGDAIKRLWFLPSRLYKYAEELGLPSVDDIIEQNTLFPCLSRFLGDADQGALIRHHLVEPESKITRIVGLTATLAPTLNWAPGICLDCQSEDMRAYDHTIWRRDFLLPEVRWCGRHNAPIFSLCDACLRRFATGKHFDIPLSRCPCGRPLAIRAKTIHRQERDVALGWQRLLDSEFAPYIGSREMGALANERAAGLGLIDERQINWVRCQEFFESQRLRGFGNSIGFRLTGRPLENALLGKKCPRHPLHAIFLLVALYGSWHAVEESLLDRSAYLEGLDDELFAEEDL